MNKLLLLLFLFPITIGTGYKYIDDEQSGYNEFYKEIRIDTITELLKNIL